MLDAPQSGFEVAHTLWTGVITIGGLIVAFFTKRTVDSIDTKADKCDVEDLKEDLKTFLARSDRQHESNTQRLDKIIMELRGRGP
jgi:hypothetical protein